MRKENVLAALTYKGTFRDYQRRLLRRVEPRIGAEKLNIVTPPGSGKMIIGLEIVCRMEAPCLILATSSAECGHWGDTLLRSFVPEGAGEGYVSYSISTPAAVTCLTYETLHAAVNRLSVTEESDMLDFSNLDFIRWVQEQGITTVVLDEAHHLPHRWQKALESFLGILGRELRVLSLTATPPYDLNKEDWARYVTLCGEFHDEIYVPELVRAGALCPHEDLVYLNHPTAAEAEAILSFRRAAEAAIAASAALPFMGSLNHRISRQYRKEKSFIYTHWQEISALCELLNEYKHPIHAKMYRQLTGLPIVSRLTVTAAELALNFLLDSKTLLSGREKEQLHALLSEHGVMEHHRVSLTLPEQISRAVTTSAGKLESIATITAAEAEALGDGLRLVVLTDAHRSEGLSNLTREEKHPQINAAAVFRAVHARCPALPIGCVSPNVTVLPAALRPLLPAAGGLPADAISFIPTEVEGYAYFQFPSPETAMTAVGTLLREGHIRVLSGSMNMLGDGWDDRFVNTLVVAACNSPFPEITHARGRAIHADPALPQKAVHVWHLATVEPSYTSLKDPGLRMTARMSIQEAAVVSAEFRTLRRRFDCFMGPTADGEQLETGLDRLGDKVENTSVEGLGKTNAAMLERTGTRTALIKTWRAATEESIRPTAEVRVPKTARVPVYTAFNTLFLILSAIAALVSALLFVPTLVSWIWLSLMLAPTMLLPTVVLLTLSIALLCASVLYIQLNTPLLCNHTRAERSIRHLALALLRTMKKLGLISPEATLVMEPIQGADTYRMYLGSCSHYQQFLYQQALAELFSPIDNPRYVLIRAGWFRHLMGRWSFTCPSVIAETDTSVKLFSRYVCPVLGTVKFQFTRRDQGVKFLLLARNQSYLNELGKPCIKKNRLGKDTDR